MNWVPKYNELAPKKNFSITLAMLNQHITHGNEPKKIAQSLNDVNNSLTFCTTKEQSLSTYRVSLIMSEVS